MLVELPGLPSDSTCILKAEPGTLDIKRREAGILLISLPSWSTLQTSDYNVIIEVKCRFNVIDDVIHKMQRPVDMIKIHAVR